METQMGKTGMSSLLTYVGNYIDLLEDFNE